MTHILLTKCLSWWWWCWRWRRRRRRRSFEAILQWSVDLLENKTAIIQTTKMDSFALIRNFVMAISEIRRPFTMIMWMAEAGTLTLHKKTRLNRQNKIMIYAHFVQQHTQMCDLSARCVCVCILHMNRRKRRANIAEFELDRISTVNAIEYKSTIFINRVFDMLWMASFRLRQPSAAPAHKCTAKRAHTFNNKTSGQHEICFVIFRLHVQIKLWSQYEETQFAFLIVSLHCR